MMRGRIGRGFTLIELLIVVAIIAILAMIAVPNFLEAQMRAKVSRVQADIRSLAVAIEAYTVDYNTWPGDPYDWGVWMNSPGSWPKMGWDWPLIVLTSPIAYITDIPIDPFSKGMATSTVGIHTWYLTKTGYYTFRHDPRNAASFFVLQRSRYLWCLDCAGPDMLWEFDRFRDYLPNYQGDVVYYDPTNGTVSQGDLYYFGPAGGYNPPPPPWFGKI